MLELFRIAIKDIYRKPFKTITFSLMISTCISALTITFNINMVINNSIDKNITNSLVQREIIIGINNTGGKSYKDCLSYLRNIPHIHDVYRYMPPVNAGINHDSLLSPGGYLLTSGDEECFPQTVTGRNFNKTEKNVAIIPQKLYIRNQILQGNSLIGKTISLTYKSKNDSSEYIYSCKVLGVYRNQLGDNSNTLYIPLDDMYKICSNSGRYESNSNLLFTAIADKQQFVDIIIRQLSSVPNISAKLNDSWNSNELVTYKMIAKIINYIVYLIFIFLQLILYLCVTNIAINNKKQTALYKALGYKNIHILIIVFLESIIISLIGYILSIIISISVNTLIINPIIDSKAGPELCSPIILMSYIIPLISIIPIALVVSLFSYFKVKRIYPTILLKQD